MSRTHTLKLGSISKPALLSTHALSNRVKADSGAIDKVAKSNVKAFAVTAEFEWNEEGTQETLTRIVLEPEAWSE